MRKILLTESDAGFTEWFADLRAKQARAQYELEGLKKAFEKAEEELDKAISYHDDVRARKWKEVLELAKKLGKVHPDVCLEEVRLEVRAEKPYKLYISERGDEHTVDLGEALQGLLTEIGFEDVSEKEKN